MQKKARAVIIITFGPMNIARAIRQKLKAQYDLIAQSRVRKNVLNAIPFWAGAFATGFVAVLYAKLFAWSEQGTVFIYQKASWLFFIISPLCFFIAWRLVARYAPFARGSGIPQVTAALELSTPKHNSLVNRLLGVRIIIVKVASSLVMAFGGGLVGREGPTIQIASSIFKKINDMLPTWYPKISRRNMIVTGAAAGLAAAFNTPLGGIVFAIEELTKTHFNYFKSALLTGVIISGLTALHVLGPYLYLGYPVLSNIPLSVILVVIPVALLSGIAGSGMGRVIQFLMRIKNNFRSTYWKIAFPVMCGIIIACIGYFVDRRALGSGKEIMVSTLFSEDKYLPWNIPLLRIFGTIFSFATGAAGGIFAPSLSAGASIGSVLSGFFHLSGSETNLMILCGMTGCLTGITRSPFTSSIVVIEMTDSHHIIFFVMLTALVASLISITVSKHSFYHYMKDHYMRQILKEESETTAKS